MPGMATTAIPTSRKIYPAAAGLPGEALISVSSIDGFYNGLTTVTGWTMNTSSSATFSHIFSRIGVGERKPRR